MNRRHFLQVSAAAAGAVAIGPELLKAATPGKQAAIWVKREEDAAAALNAAIAATGDLGFLKRGDSVLIKPCVNSAELWPATSSPELIKLLVKVLKNRGAGDVIVADSSGPGRDAEDCMKKCGILDAAKSAGAKMVYFDKERFVELDVKEARNWRGKMLMPQIMRDVHHVISLPTVRTHSVAGFTMAIKNYVGLVPKGKRMPYMHNPFGFPERLGELTLLRNPDLILLDGRRAFIAGGPDKGTLVKPGLFAAGTDQVALDVLGLAILKKNGAGARISGQSPWQNAIIRRAAEVAGGVRSGADIRVEAVQVAEINELLKFMEVSA